MTCPEHLLKKAQIILLVDWPNAGIPRALVEMGLTVFGCSPRGYTRVRLVSSPPSTPSVGTVLPPQNKHETDFLLFQRLDAPPPAVDIVCVYRPSSELSGILANHALPLHAKALWLLRPAESAQERGMVEQLGLTFVEHCDLAGLAGALSKRGSS
jgi:hypothetical protein